MKDNQAKYPQLRFKGFTDPWEQHKLGEVVEMFNGDRGINYPKNNDLVPEGVPFINAGDLQNGQVNLESCKKISKEKFNQLSGAKIRRGDILYCLRGTIGKNALVEFDEGTVASSLVDIRPKNIDRMYLFIILNSNIEYRQRLLNDEGAAQPNLSVRNLSKFYIPVPQTKEQHKISVFFKSFNELLTLHQRKLAKLKELKQGYMQKLFPQNGSKFPQLRFAGFADAWEQRKLSEIADHRGGTAIEKYFEKDGKYRVISIGSYGLDSQYIDQNIRALSNEVTDERVVHAGELTMVLNDKTTNGTIIGRSLLIDQDNKYVINQRTEIISPKEKFDSDFAYTVLNGPFREKVKRIVQGGTQIYVNYPAVSNLNVEIPNIDEQQRIGSFFKQLDYLITLHQRKLEKLQELKKGYLQKMFC